MSFPPRTGHVFVPSDELERIAQILAELTDCVVGLWGTSLSDEQRSELKDLSMLTKHARSLVESWEQVARGR